MAASLNNQVYYGWKIVAAILVLLTFTSGLSFYNHAIYLNALATRPAFDVSTASMAVSIFFFTGGISGLGVARWVQDYDPRICISVGAVISFVSLCLLAYVNTVWQLFLVYALFGTGFSASSLIPATTLITRWFHRRRAMALSIASTGLSLGGVILTPLSVLLVDSLGFEVAAPILGVTFLLGVAPVAWIFLRKDPASMGLNIDGLPDDLKADSGSVATGSPRILENGITFRQARGGKFFWSISLAYIFLMMAQVGGIAHQYGLARELLTDAQTAVAVAILPIASIVGRLLGGWLVDRMSIRVFAIGMMILQATSLSLLSGGFNIFTLCIGLALFGTTVGNLLMLQPLLIAEAFGVRDYAKIFSVSNLMSSWGTALGPALLGFVYTASENLYGVAYAVAATAGAVGMMLFLTGGKIQKAS
ncbi:MAG: MFS transporter [Proteobacteria bacterium]|nr:MFS transporter [Pseudomonadota bacterium]